MTAERLLRMPAADFDMWTAQHPATSRRLLGGE